MCAKDDIWAGPKINTWLQRDVEVNFINSIYVNQDLRSLTKNGIESLI